MKIAPVPDTKTSEPFLSDVKTLRAQARRHIETGAVSNTYVGDVARTIAILQTVLATEIVCVLRYTQHSIVAKGLASEGVKAEFAQHAKEEHERVGLRRRHPQSPQSANALCDAEPLELRDVGSMFEPSYIILNSKENSHY